MKAVRRAGCWTVFALIVALGTLVFLFTSTRQERGEFSGRPIRGNVAILGGDVLIASDEFVRGNLLVVGDDLTLEGQIRGNLVVVGGDVDLTEDSRVGGNVSVLGGDADIGPSSVVGGNVAVVGGDVELIGDSRVAGNVSVIGGRVTEDPKAAVGGNLSWRIYTNRVAQPGLYGAEPTPLALIDPPSPPEAPNPPLGNAEILGEEALEEAAEAARDQIERHQEAAKEAIEAARDQAKVQREAAQNAVAAARAQAASSRTPWFLVFLRKLVQAFLWTLLITGLVLLFAWLLPKQVKAITETAEKETALSFAAGAIGIMGSAILAAILTVTICFALLALPLLALLALVLLCGWTVTCYGLGRRLDELVAGPGDSSWNPLISVGLSSLVVTGVTAFSWVIFPCLGFIVALLIGSTGTGAVIVHVARRSGRLPGGALGGRTGGPAPGDGSTSPESRDEGDTRVGVSKAGLPVLSESPVGANEESFEESPEKGEEESTPGTDRQEITDSLSAVSATVDEGDDLTRIVGIGPTYAARLREAGIATFSQLAALDAEEIAEVIGCPALRVERERLREQAGELAG